MRKYITSYQEFISVNEELSFLPTIVEYNKRTIGWKRIIYTFTIDDADVKVIFNKEEQNESTYTREYHINGKFTKIKTNNGNKIISAVTYITETFLDEYQPNLLVIYHLPDGNQYSKNKRAKINKPYLTNISKEYGYKYVLIDAPEYDDDNVMNGEISFIYNNFDDVEKYMINNAIDVIDNNIVFEELSFNSTPVDYKINTDYVQKKEYRFNIDNNEIVVIFNSMDWDNKEWERAYGINGSIKRDNNLNIKVKNKILSNLSYITEEFIKKYQPELLYINHHNDELPSERRMKIQKNYLQNIASKFDYIYSIYEYDGEYFSLLTKNIEIRSNFITGSKRKYNLFFEKR